VVTLLVDNQGFRAYNMGVVGFYMHIGLPNTQRADREGDMDIRSWFKKKQESAPVALPRGILDVTKPFDFCADLFGYLVDKRASGQSLSQVEQVAYSLLDMGPTIQMDGFVDLFYQAYSLRECAIVEEYLRRLGLSKLADLFAEAKSLYVQGRSDITEEAYREIDPFAMTGEEGARFDELGEMATADGSELWLIPDRVFEYVKANSVPLT